jgi:hypothetical protein
MLPQDMSLYIRLHCSWRFLAHSSLCCPWMCVLQYPVLPLEVYVLQHYVLSLAMSCLQQPMLPPEHVSFIAVCTVFKGRFLAHSSLCCPWMCVLQHPVLLLPLEVFVVHCTVFCAVPGYVCVYIQQLYCLGRCQKAAVYSVVSLHLD